METKKFVNDAQELFTMAEQFIKHRRSIPTAPSLKDSKYSVHVHNSDPYSTGSSYKKYYM